jgi:hypothetical protein
MLRAPLVLSKTRLENLNEVRNLNLWGNELTDVTLLSSLPNLEIISLSINQITTLSTFSHCTKLKEIYLRKNCISDVAEVVYLQGLRELHTLWLSDNPCAMNNTEEGPWYRPFVLRMLPQLRKLDNILITAEERANALATNNEILHAMHKRAHYIAKQIESPLLNSKMNIAGRSIVHTGSKSESSGGGGGTKGVSSSVEDRSYIHMEGRDLNFVDIQTNEREGRRSSPQRSSSSSPPPPPPRQYHSSPSQQYVQERREHTVEPRELSPRSKDIEKMVNKRVNEANPLDHLGGSDRGTKTVRKKLISRTKPNEVDNIMERSIDSKPEWNGGNRNGRVAREVNNDSDLDSSSALAVATLLLNRMNKHDLKVMSNTIHQLLKK